MTVILAGLILILAAAVIFALRRAARVEVPRLVKTIVLGVGWVLVALGRLKLGPVEFLYPWTSAGDLVFAVDAHGWAFAQIAVTVGLFQAIWGQGDQGSLDSGLRLTGVVVLACAAGNPLLLAVFWVLLDLVWYAFRVSTPGLASDRRLTFIPGLLIASGPMGLAALSLFSGGSLEGWTGLPGSFAPYLAGLAVLRLSVLNPPRGRTGAEKVNPLADWFLRLPPNVLACLLVVRAAGIFQGEVIRSVWVAMGLVLVGLLAVSSASGRHFSSVWVLGMFGISAAAALSQQPEISRVWAAVLLLGGTLIHSLHGRADLSGIDLVLLASVFSGLPFTPLWGSASPVRGVAGAWPAALGAGLLAASGIFWAAAGHREPAGSRAAPPARSWIGAGLLIFFTYWITGSPAWWRGSLTFWEQPAWSWILPLASLGSLFLVRLHLELPPAVSRIAGAAGTFSRLVTSAGEAVLSAAAAGFREILTLLEGRGGLVWTLLCAALMLSLLLSGGG